MNRSALAYLASYLLSLLGNSIAAIALPLIVLQTTGSALGAGAIAAATAVPAVLAGLFMGVVIDRINRISSSVLTDLVSAAAIAALPIVDAIAGLDIGWFVLFGIVGSLGDVPGMTARDALLPAVVSESGINAERLVGVREGLGAIAMLLGPAAAGTLMVLFEGTTVLWITAATSLAAALITLAIPRRVGVVVRTQTTGAKRGNGWTQLRDGWRVLLGSRFLMTVTAVSLLTMFVLAALQGLILPVFFTVAGQPQLLGFVLSALAAGLLIGSVIYAIAGARGPRRAWFIVGVLGTTVGFGAIATLSSVVMVFVGAFCIGLASGLFGALVGVLMIERIPDDMRGRIMGTQNALATGVPTLGLVLAAVITEYAGVELAAIVITAFWLVAAVIALAAPSLRNLEPSSGEATRERVEAP